MPWEKRKKLPHYSYRDLKEISIYLSEKENDPEYTRLFSRIETLHANFYHNSLKEKAFAMHKEDTEKLIAKLKVLKIQIKKRMSINHKTCQERTNQELCTP